MLDDSIEIFILAVHNSCLSVLLEIMVCFRPWSTAATKKHQMKHRSTETIYHPIQITLVHTLASALPHACEMYLVHLAQCFMLAYYVARVEVYTIVYSTL
jgi:hypothetical protein